MDIKVYDDALSYDVCTKLISYFEESNEKIPAYVYNGAEPNAERKGTVVILPKDGMIGKLRQEILTITRHYISEFGKEHHGLNVMVTEPFLLTNPRIEKIGIGEGFDWHMDARQHQSDRRFLTVLYYLNDQDKGGETSFYYQGINMIPKHGRLVLFPPFWTHIHKGGTPLKTPKYTLGMFATLEQ
jgi:prolyl 4-hydroxylase